MEMYELQKILEHLELKGFIEIRDNPDDPNDPIVILTDKGREVFHSEELRANPHKYN